MEELKKKYEASMRDVLHILGKYDYQYIKQYVESLENRLNINESNELKEIEQNFDKISKSLIEEPGKK